MPLLNIKLLVCSTGLMTNVEDLDSNTKVGEFIGELISSGVLEELDGDMKHLIVARDNSISSDNSNSTLNEMGIESGQVVKVVTKSVGVNRDENTIFRFEYIAKLISRNEVFKAIQSLKKGFKANDIDVPLVLLENRYGRLQDAIISGVLSRDQYNVEESSIAYSVLQYAESLRKKKLLSNYLPPEKLDQRLFKVTFSKFGKEFISLYVSLRQFTSFQDLLDKIFFIISPKVSPNSYGKEWYLFVQGDPIFKVQLNDDRNIEEVGIIENVEVEVVGIKYIENIFKQK